MDGRPGPHERGILVDAGHRKAGEFEHHTVDLGMPAWTAFGTGAAACLADIARPAFPFLTGCRRGSYALGHRPRRLCAVRYAPAPFHLPVSDVRSDTGRDWRGGLVLDVPHRRGGMLASIGDPTLADAILDRLMHNAYQPDLKGESMRRTRGPLNQTDHFTRSRPRARVRLFSPC